MELEFVKLHGLGNDFVFIDDLARKMELTAEQVAWLCDRHFGIGGDGVILVRPSERPDCVAYMHYINSDGTLAQMCGNGVRCFAKYLVDRGHVKGADPFTVETLAGPRTIGFSTDDCGKLVSATVDMGEPILEPSTVPTALEANAVAPSGAPCVLDAPIESPYGTFSFSCISMGNPHAVCFIEDMGALDDALFADADHKSLDALRLDDIGAFFEGHPAFPEKANIEFATVTDTGLAMRVFERGCGETLACGTGACATAVAAALTGRAGNETDIALKGGTLHIDIASDGHVRMTGPAAEAFVGSVVLPS